MTQEEAYTEKVRTIEIELYKLGEIKYTIDRDEVKSLYLECVLVVDEQESSVPLLVSNVADYRDGLQKLWEVASISVMKVNGRYWIWNPMTQCWFFRTTFPYTSNTIKI